MADVSMSENKDSIVSTSESTTAQDQKILTDRTATATDGAEGEAGPSKSALKKAARQEKLAQEKAEKKANAGKEPVGKAEAKKPTSKASAAKKKIDGAALIGIDVSKEDDFSGWYQQVLTKGDMLDYYDVSGCYILKVCGGDSLGRSSIEKVDWADDSLLRSRRRTLFGKKFKIGSTRRSRV